MYVEGSTYTGEGPSKRVAKMIAAKSALQSLRSVGILAVRESAVAARQRSKEIEKNTFWEEKRKAYLLKQARKLPSEGVQLQWPTWQTDFTQPPPPLPSWTDPNQQWVDPSNQYWTAEGANQPWTNQSQAWPGVCSTGWNQYGTPHANQGTDGGFSFGGLGSIAAANASLQNYAEQSDYAGQKATNSKKKGDEKAGKSNKNALSKLNEFSPGLSFEIIAQSEDKLDPSFTVMVKLGGKPFVGIGGSKKTAKLVVAEKALRWAKLWDKEDEEIQNAYFKDENIRLEKRRAYLEMNEVMSNFNKLAAEKSDPKIRRGSALENCDVFGMGRGPYMEDDYRGPLGDYGFRGGDYPDGYREQDPYGGGYRGYREDFGGHEGEFGGYEEGYGEFGEEFGGHGGGFGGYEEGYGEFGEEFGGHEEGYGGYGEDFGGHGGEFGGYEENFGGYGEEYSEQWDMGDDGWGMDEDQGKGWGQGQGRGRGFSQGRGREGQGRGRGVQSLLNLGRGAGPSPARGFGRGRGSDEGRGRGFGEGRGRGFSEGRGRGFSQGPPRGAAASQGKGAGQSPGRGKSPGRGGVAGGPSRVGQGGGQVGSRWDNTMPKYPTSTMKVGQSTRGKESFFNLESSFRKAGVIKNFQELEPELTEEMDTDWY